MAFDLYLVITDNTGAPVPGQSLVRGLRNPLRGNAPVTSPFEVQSYSIGALAPFAAGTASKVDFSELVVDMVDDAAAALLFRYICAGKRFKTVDVLGVTPGARDGQIGVTAAAGVASALLTAVSWTATTDGLARRLTFDGQIFAVGSATQNADGSFAPFAFATWDTTKNAPS